MELRYGKPEEAGMSSEHLDKLRRLGAGWVEDGIVPAVIMLVARRGIIVLHEAAGKLTPDADSPEVLPDSIFAITSVTKPITATCALTLVEEGLLGLNRPVQEYIPEFSGAGKEDVLVHHLLTHTSGLTDEAVQTTLEGRNIPMRPGIPVASFEDYLTGVRAICDTDLSRPPGDEMAYSGYGYYLLGELVRRVGGEPLEKLAPARIFGPLGMKDTIYPPAFDDARRARTVVREGPAGRILPPSDDVPPVANRGANGVFSTVLDLGIFGQMFLNQGKYGHARILSRPSIREITRNQIPGIPARIGDEYHKEASWGYGWSIRGQEAWKNFSPALESPTAFGHSGISGVTLSVDPKNETVLVCLAAQSLTMEAVASGKTDAWRGDFFVNTAIGAIED